MKIGIIGAGAMAMYHLMGFRKAGAEVVSIMDVDTKKAKAFAEKYQIPAVHANLDEALLAGEDIEAVSIAVPNAFHKEITIHALGKGLSVFCEKPPALNGTEMEQMQQAALRSGKLLMFDFNNRARSETRSLKTYIDKGVVGNINSVQAYWIRRNGIPGFGGWFTNKRLSGGGPVIDLLHMLDLALYFMGYPEPSVVLATTFDSFMGNPDFKGPWGIKDGKNDIGDVESSLQAMIVFKGGASLLLRNSWAEMIERETAGVRFQGTKAGALMERTFVVDGFDATSNDRCLLFTCENHMQVDRTIRLVPDESMGRLASAENFVESLEGKALPFNTPAEALRLMKIVDALYESAKTLEPVKL